MKVKNLPFHVSPASLAVYYSLLRDFIDHCIRVDKMSPSATSLLVMDLGEASSEINSRIMAGDTCFTIGSHSLLLIKMLANLVNQSNNQTKHSNRLPENTQGQVSTFLCNLFDKLQTSECITDLSLDNIKVAKGFIEKCIKTSPNSRKRHFSNRKSSNSHSRNPNKRPCLDNFKTPKRQDGGSVWQTIDNLEGKLASEKRYSTKLEGKVASEKRYSTKVNGKLAREERYSAGLEDDLYRIRDERASLERDIKRLLSEDDEDDFNADDDDDEDESASLKRRLSYN